MSKSKLQGKGIWCTRISRITLYIPQRYGHGRDGGAKYFFHRFSKKNKESRHQPRGTEADNVTNL
jgi:hypothetical protein